MVQVTYGVTLDLNGYNLTVDYLVGFKGANVVDNKTTGKLIAAMDNVVLDESNPMIPVYDGKGYIFTKVGFAVNRDTKYTGTECISSKSLALN